MLPQFSSTQLLEDFLNKLLTDGGMDTVTAEVREEMLNDLRARLEQRLQLTLATNLSEADLASLNKMGEEKASEEQVAKFIDEKVPNASELFAAAMLNFRQDYLGVK